MVPQWHWFAWWQVTRNWRTEGISSIVRAERALTLTLGLNLDRLKLGTVSLKERTFNEFSRRKFFLLSS